jgi:translocation and assembly module TamB
MFAGLAAFGQDDDETGSVDPAEDNGFIINFIQEKISGPGRDIQIRGVEGALSSDARIAGITVSDDQGPWLEIENISLDWSRLALLRGRVSVNELSFGRIAMLRKPNPVASAPTPEASSEPFALPELPVSVRVDSLVADTVELSEPILGEAVDFHLEGHATLEDGALESGLDVRRIDEPGGTMSLDADYSNANQHLAIDLDLQEPAGGLLSNVLNIEGRPPLSLTVAGEGPLENVDINLDLRANDQTLVQGVLSLRDREAGQGFALDLGGEVSPLIPSEYRDFFAGRTSVNVSGVSKSAGGIRLDELDVSGAVLTLDGRLETGADNFLQSLNLSGQLGDPAGAPVLLPVPGADTRL